MSDVTITAKQLKKCLTRQEDEYSCGPACLATIAKLCGCSMDYHFFRDLLAPRPGFGTHALEMLDAARQHLPLTDAGNQLYKSGLALGYIVYQDIELSPSQPSQAVDHYVVLLARKENRICYYDPWDNKVYLHDEKKMRWHSTRQWPALPDRLEKWAANFKSVAGLDFDLCATIAQPHPYAVAAPQKSAKPAKRTRSSAPG